MKLTEKQFAEAIKNPLLTRSTLKRWKRAYYLKVRGETPLNYYNRLLSYIT